ncbi:hypothetical protein M1271_05040 [Patescibacteria group bacterium]|nr:hypothetical protein [Patescibacteria group bacterium]MCL5797896.1 hypothetical protein [Patescibacteria group bacterium]
MKAVKIFVAVGAILIILLLTILLFVQSPSEKLKSIKDFDSCAEAGYPVMQSNPQICKTPAGRTFTKNK